MIHVETCCTQPGINLMVNFETKADFLHCLHDAKRRQLFRNDFSGLCQYLREAMSSGIHAPSQLANGYSCFPPKQDMS